MKKRICFIINPKSGNRKKNHIPLLIEEILDKNLFDYEIHYTSYKKHGIELTKIAIEKRFDIVCAVGGDGTVHEIGTTLINTNLCLAIIPRGSGNGFARHLRIPLNSRKAIECLNKQNQTIIDTANLNEFAFINVCGFGFDAHIAHKFDTLKKRGFNAYIKLVLREFWNYTPNTFELNEQKLESALLLSVANASQFGNGFKISPESKINDGKLELVMLKKMPLLSIPALVLRFFKGTIQKSKQVEITSFEKVSFKIKNKDIHIDGEPLTLKTNDIRINIVPKSLNVITG